MPAKKTYQGLSNKLSSDDLSTFNDENKKLWYQVAISQGLASNHIINLISIIESKEVGNKTKLSLMKCLIPQETIPEEAFIRMMSLLSNFKLSAKLKIEILRWMISVYSFIEPLSSSFKLLYEIFFGLLDQKILRPYVCHLMFLINSQKLVTHRRISQLFKLIMKYGKQPWLLLVMHSYYKLCPEYFEEEMADFKCHFKSLGVYPGLIQRVHTSYKPPATDIEVSTQESNNSQKASEMSATGEVSNTTFFRLDPFQETYKEFKSLETSTNMSKILESKLRRLILTSHLPPKTEIKLTDYILTYMFQCMDSCELLDILEIFHDKQHSMPAVSDFTERLLSLHYSDSYVDTIIEILHYEPMNCFEKIIYKMDLIYEQLLKSSVPVKCKWLSCFSKMYVNWLLNEYDELQVPCDRKFCASVDCSSINDQSHSSLNLIYQLGTYIGLICDALILDDSHPCLLNEILLHYERVSIARMKVDKDLVIQFPTDPVFHQAIFSLSECTLDNLCRLLLRYNAEVRHMQKKKHPEAKLAAYELTLRSNDIRKMLLSDHNSSTNLSRTNLFKRLIQIKGKYSSFGKWLMLHKHPALFLKALPFVRSNHPSNFQANADFRKAFLEHLAEDGPENLLKLVSLM